MRIATLGSGSRGNATLVEGGGVRVLVDCGLPVREVERRLALIGVAPQTLEAVLLTHEHGDHVRGVGALARKYGLAVWSSAGTWRGARCGEVPKLELFTPHQSAFALGGLSIQPYPVPHDAREPCQFALRSAGRCFVMLTDTGCVTPHVLEVLAACDGLLIECNHYPDMLRSGPYPPALQGRVGGALGHLSNQQAAEALGRIDERRLGFVVAAHLSEQNNRPEAVRQALLEVCPGLDGRLSVAEQDAPGEWLSL